MTTPERMIQETKDLLAARPVELTRLVQQILVNQTALLAAVKTQLVWEEE